MAIRIHPIIAEARALRQRKGLSQDEIAWRAGFNHHQINRWETGKNHPSLESASTYLEALGFRLTIEPLDEASPMPRRESPDFSAGLEAEASLAVLKTAFEFVFMGKGEV